MRRSPVAVACGAARQYDLVLVLLRHASVRCGRAAWRDLADLTPAPTRRREF